MGAMMDLIIRREKQLKRVIESARAWMESERACSREYDELLNDHAWHRWPEEKPKPDNIYLVWCRDGSLGWPALAYFSPMTDAWCGNSGTLGAPVTHWQERPPGPEDV